VSEPSDLKAFAVAYRDSRGRVRDLLSNAGAGAVEQVAPAAPAWRVHDLLAHLSGVAADITAGNLEGVATDEWTAAQVETRRDWPVERMLDEWDEHGAAVDVVIPQFPELIAGQLLVDTATHEQDIRGALDAPGARDASSIALAFAPMARFALSGGLRLHSEYETVVTGDGDPSPTTTVRAPRFEFFRAMTGRRSLDQIRAYEWSGDPRPEDLVIGIFTARTSPLVE
jgi:uncharacterized protein (TIGR03083 family)